MSGKSKSKGFRDRKIKPLTILSEREKELLELHGPMLAENFEGSISKMSDSKGDRFRESIGDIPDRALGFAERLPEILRGSNERFRSGLSKLSKGYEAPNQKNLTTLYDLYFGILSESIETLGLSSEDEKILNAAISKCLEADMIGTLGEFCELGGKRLDVIERFHEALRGANSVLSDHESEPLGMIFNEVAKGLIEIVGVKLVWVGLRAPKESSMKFLTVSGQLSESLGDLRISIGDGPSDPENGIIVFRPESLTVVNLGDPRFEILKERTNSKISQGVVSLSFRSEGSEEWNIGLCYDGYDSFLNEIEAFLGNLAEDFGKFMERRKKKIRLERLERYRTAFEKIQEELLKDLSTESIYSAMVDTLVEYTDACEVYTAVPQKDSGWISLVCAAGTVGEELTKLKVSKDSSRSHGRTLVARIFREGHPIVLDLSKAGNDYAELWKEYPALRAEVSAGWPIFFNGDKAPGAILVINSLEPNYFDPELRKILKELVSSVNMALKRSVRKNTLEWLGLHDSLTSLPNRAYFEKSAMEAIARAKRDKKNFAMGIMDLDKFKEWNDILGHLAGDKLLKDVAELLRMNVRTGDGIARLGGDEFAFHVTFSDLGDLEGLSERLLKSLSSVQKEGLGITGSLGWAIYPDDGQDFNTLISHADQALYTAKTDGRNVYRFFNERIAKQNQKDFEVRRSFSRAVESGELLFYLQPKGDCRKGIICGAEMLVRWKKDGDCLSAVDFIHNIEKDSKLIRELGRYVLKESGRLRNRLKEMGLSMKISLNIGARHFLNPLFLEDVEEFLKNGNNLVVEITENSILENIGKANRMIDELKRRGFEVSLDDFGTGYSSLIHASRLPVDEIKLDQNFIRDFRKNINAFAVAGSTIILGRLSERPIVAEGIEDSEDLGFWLRMGGRYIQGYLLARPMPESEFIEWIKDLKPICKIVSSFDFEDITLLQYVFMDPKKAQIRDYHGDFERCHLTKWFEDRRAVYGQLPSFGESEDSHKKFHELLEKDDPGVDHALKKMNSCVYRLYEEIAVGRDCGTGYRMSSRFKY